MSYLVKATAYLVHYILLVIDIALIVRAIFSFIGPDIDSPIFALACYITEPIILISSKILDFFRISNAGFFDMSFFLAVMLTWSLDLLVGTLL